MFSFPDLERGSNEKPDDNVPCRGAISISLWFGGLSLGDVELSDHPLV